MNRTYRTPSLAGGFSLIEVMIAVVVLATGLLALAALQASLTRASGDSKTRSRVAAMLTARMDELRSVGYNNALLDPGAGGTTTSTADGCDGDATDWVDCARVQANLGSLSVTQTNSLFTSTVGGTTFAQVNARPADDSNPEFIRVTLNASWQTADTTTGNHSLAMTSEFSSLALRDSLLPPPPGSNTPTGRPIVRTDNPAGPGVIPVAVGGGDATAASNPRPEVVGKNNNAEVVGTRFDVLTYSGMLGSSVIQRRVETTVVKCQCSLGAGGTNLPTIYQKSEWPAIWTGERYDIFKPVSATTLPPGQGKSSGPKPGVEQSPLCQECCRDHFDATGTTNAKFDPERTGAHDHFSVNSSGALIAMSGNDYVESCRLIRVDGFWRTAADMYSRQMGLLATEIVNNKEAATGLPRETPTVTNYQAFVKDYLAQISGSTGTPPTNAQTMFDQTARGLNEPDDVDIATPSSKDYRYLHSRGLYLDHLEDKARTMITKILADTGPNGKCPTGSDTAECILPYLPFTTINVTELAKWQASNTTVLSVNSGNLLGANPSQPSGGRSVGVKKGTSDNNVSINMSNFGLAATSDTKFSMITGIDTEDAAAVGTDKQLFDVGGDNSPPSSGDEFTVNVSGITTQDPDVFYSVASGADVGECLRAGTSAPYRCSTDTSGIAGGSITLSNYWIETVTSRSVTATCTKPNGTTATVTSTVNVPTFKDFFVSSASIVTPSANGNIGTPVNDHKKSETTTITFGTLAANSVINVVLSPQSLQDSEQYATVATCTTNGSGNQLNNVTWTRPWQ
jgi:prepilin-type N-terminal cleavage/methylation domain-containing protein